jgi:hypothetical protein
MRPGNEGRKPVPKFIALLIIALSWSAPALACDTICQALKNAAESAPYEGSAKSSGVPQACLTLAPNDPDAEVVLAIHYSGNQTVFSTRWRKGAALATGGTEGVPMICFDKKRLDGATAIMVCNADVMVFIRTKAKLDLLREKGRNPRETPVCMRSAAECSAT